MSEDAVPEGARLFFLDSDGNRADTFTGELNFDTTNKTKTTNVTVYVEVNCMVQPLQLQMYIITLIKALN